ncbi:MAG: hypothetical protein KF729_19600 [Sandaracinaceae bacterium]|nr:hypothetical protein [Sandaracinaceae bacterium]
MSVAGAASERARAVDATVRARGVVAPPLGPRALVPDADGPLACVPDGNRSVIVPSVTVEHAGRRFLLSVKGAGASAPAYDAFPLDGVGPRVIAGESWMGDAPYGGQGERGALDALAVAALADDASTIAGACVCPVAAVVEVPEAHVRRDCFWYRRFRGPVVQEHRLVPSDVRLFHGTEGALGRDPARALAALGVRDVEALDAFIERFLATGVAAITLWARTARPTADGGFEGLDYDDVWLDKDALVAPDGSLFLVDLESIEWTPTTARAGAAARIAKQLDRNYYDVMYGLDALLGVRDAWLDRAPDRDARRASAAARLALALAPDPFVCALEVDGGLDLEVRAPDGAPVRARVIDRR